MLNKNLFPTSWKFPMTVSWTNKPAFSRKLCLHLACGTVYLKSNKKEHWINIDIQHDKAFLAVDRPDLVRKNGTTLQHYYKRRMNKSDFMKGKGHEREVVCDEFMDITKMIGFDNNIDKIVAIQVLEHFPYDEGRFALMRWFNALKKGGSLQVHVPDIEGVINEDTDMDWKLRQIYGSQKNEFNVHKAGYTQDSLVRLLINVGFSTVEVLENIHSYPSICLRAIK